MIPDPTPAAQELSARKPNQETARRIRDQIGRIYARGSVLDESGQLRALGKTSVTGHGGAFLANLIHTERPCATLEIGMAWGLSTLFILQALLENGGEFEPHVVIDPFQRTAYQNAARRSLDDLGVANLVEFYEEPSELLLPRFVQEKRTFDFAFVDGGHRFDCVFTDLRFIHKLLKPGGLIVFDDANWEGVGLTCRFAETNYGYSAVADDLSEPPTTRKRDRFGAPLRPRTRALRKPIDPADPPGSFFVPFFLEFLPISVVQQMMQAGSRELRHEGHLALRAGNRAMARQYFKLALRSDPTHFKTWLRLARTYLPPGLAHSLGGRTR